MSKALVIGTCESISFSQLTVYTIASKLFLVPLDCNDLNSLQNRLKSNQLHAKEKKKRELGRSRMMTKALGVDQVVFKINKIKVIL